jgi:hypothetical protein
MTPPIQRRTIQVLADAFTAVRSAATNQAISAVTLDQLIQDQILINGESTDSNNSRFDPYSFDPGALQPAGDAAITPALFAGGTDTTRPTKSARLLAIKNNLKAVIDELKKIPPEDLVDALALEDADRDPILEAQADLEAAGG